MAGSHNTVPAIREAIVRFPPFREPWYGSRHRAVPPGTASGSSTRGTRDANEYQTKGHQKAIQERYLTAKALR